MAASIYFDLNISDEFDVIGNDNVIPCCFGEHEMSAEEESAAFAAKRR